VSAEPVDRALALLADAAATIHQAVRLLTAESDVPDVWVDGIDDTAATLRAYRRRIQNQQAAKT